MRHEVYELTALRLAFVVQFVAKVGIDSQLLVGRSQTFMQSNGA